MSSHAHITFSPLPPARYITCRLNTLGFAATLAFCWMPYARCRDTPLHVFLYELPTPIELDIANIL